jgi:hypothetical protein
MVGSWGNAVFNIRRVLFQCELKNRHYIKVNEIKAYTGLQVFALEAIVT